MDQKIPWIEKYRPDNLNGILGQDHIITALRKTVKDKSMPHLLFYGTSGTGKTSTITAIAKELYGKYYNFMVLELNASNERGIEIVRTRIKQFVMGKNVFYGETEKEREGVFKLVILDETDAMTVDGQAILRRVIEKYTQTTRFCLICNNIEKIDPALQSRCTKFRFSPIGRENIRKKVLEIRKAEKIKVTEQGIDTIIRRANGDMRRVLNILQSVSMISTKIDKAAINNCIGYPQDKHIQKIMTSLTTDAFSKSYKLAQTLMLNNGLSLNDIIEEIVYIFVQHITGNGEYSDYFKNIDKVKILNILDQMRAIEYAQSTNVTDKIQLGSFVGLFH